MKDFGKRNLKMSKNSRIMFVQVWEMGQNSVSSLIYECLANAISKRLHFCLKPEIIKGYVKF